MGRIDVPVNIELQRGVDADDAEAADDLRVIADLLRTQDQPALVIGQSRHDPFVHGRGERDR